jgi:hypothetical protein
MMIIPGFAKHNPLTHASSPSRRDPEIPVRHSTFFITERKCCQAHFDVFQINNGGNLTTTQVTPHAEAAFLGTQVNHTILF